MFKTVGDEGKTKYELRFASSVATGRKLETLALACGKMCNSKSALLSLPPPPLLPSPLFPSPPSPPTQCTVDPLGPDDDVAPLLGDHTHNSTHITVTRGDYAPLMERVVKNLEQAKVCM